MLLWIGVTDFCYSTEKCLLKEKGIVIFAIFFWFLFSFFKGCKRTWGRNCIIQKFKSTKGKQSQKNIWIFAPKIKDYKCTIWIFAPKIQNIFFITFLIILPKNKYLKKNTKVQFWRENSNFSRNCNIWISRQLKLPRFTCKLILISCLVPSLKMDPNVEWFQSNMTMKYKKNISKNWRPPCRPFEAH